MQLAMYLANVVPCRLRGSVEGDDVVVMILQLSDDDQQLGMVGTTQNYFFLKDATNQNIIV